MANTDVKIRITAKDDTAPAFNKAQASINALKTGASALSSTLGVGFGVGAIAGLAAFAKAAVDSLDALNDLSDATGASIENISALEDVAARTGTKFETVQTALIKFNSALNAAKPDSPAAQAIEAIGLSVEKLKAEDPAEALRLTAVALAGFADDGNKARIVQELFGKSVKEVAPLLKDLAESGKLVATVTTEQAKEAEKLNQQFSKLEKSITDVGRSIASDLLPSLNAAIDKFIESRKAGKSFLDIFSENQAKGAKEGIKLLTGIDFTQKPPAGKREVTGMIGGSLLNDQTNARIKRQEGSPVLPRLPSSFDDTKTTKGAAPRQSEADRYLETLQKQLEKSQDLSAVQQLGFDIAAGRAGKLNVDQQNNLVQLALKIDAIKAETQAEKELAEVLKEKRSASTAEGDAVAKANEEYQALLSRLLGNTSAVKFEEQTAGLEVLRTELESGRIKADQYAEAVTNLFGLTATEASKTNDLAKELGLSFTSAFEDAIVGGQSFSEVLQGLEKDIIRIVTRKMVTEPLGNAISGAVSGFNPGNFLSSLFSADGGGYTGAGSRTGGMDGKGGFMAMLHPQETVIDHTKGQRAGNSVNLVINQSFAQGTSRATTLQAAADASRQLQYAGRNL